MRRILTGLIVAASVGLAGCATLDPTGLSVLRGGSSITAQTQNPIGLNQLYEIEAAYAVVLRSALSYRRLPLCRAGQVESFTHTCARRPVVLQMQATDMKVRRALTPLRSFVRNNQTVSAISAARAAWAALADYRNVLAINGVQVQ